VPDFPRAGIVFKDLTPLLASAEALRCCVDALVDHLDGRRVDAVVGVEARGFILAAPVAYRLGAGFVPVRKPGKLPWRVESEAYALEYGTDALEIHADALVPGSRVMVVDDVLATGGTAAATVTLVERLGAEVVALGFVLELGFLGGRSRLEGRDVISLLAYE
ncbi:MAG: adenine phosphoribosyltransferase, partial [Acidimicrobiales bacterium]